MTKTASRWYSGRRRAGDQPGPLGPLGPAGPGLPHRRRRRRGDRAHAPDRRARAADRRRPDQGLFLRQPRRPRLRRQDRLGRVPLRAAQPLRGLRRRGDRAGDPHRLPRPRRRGDRRRRLARRLHGGGGDLPLSVAVPRRGGDERQLRPRGADGSSRQRGLLLLGAAELPAQPRRRRPARPAAPALLHPRLRPGPLGEPGRSWRMAGVLGAKGIPNRVDPWGPEYDHDWPTWRRDAADLPRRPGAADPRRLDR